MAVSARIREIIEDFIDIYKNEECLWKIKSKEYHDKGKRETAYEKLIEQLKKIDPDANKEIVVKKINNLRSNYRKELKKVNASSSGDGITDVYEPKLWYFHLFSFLQDQEVPRKSRSTLEENETQDSIQTDTENTDSEIDDSTNRNTQSIGEEDTLSTTPQNAKRPPLKRKTQQLQAEVLKTVKDHFARPQVKEDRYEIFGKSVGMKLKELPSQQRIIAEKIINDTLFEAEMGNLTTAYKLCPHTHYTYPETQSPQHSWGSSSTRDPPSPALSQHQQYNIPVYAQALQQDSSTIHLSLSENSAANYLVQFNNTLEKND